MWDGSLHSHKRVSFLNWLVCEQHIILLITCPEQFSTPKSLFATSVFKGSDDFSSKRTEVSPAPLFRVGHVHLVPQLEEKKK